MAELKSAERRKKEGLEFTVERLLLEALEEEDTEKAVELFLAARLVRIVHKRKADASTQSF